MRQHSFITQLRSLAVVFGIILTFASCANEDVAQNPTNPDDDNDKNLTTFVAGDETRTRTSMDYNTGNFFWGAYDYIYVKDDDGTWQRSNNAPTSKVATFKYKVPGKFTASTSYKVYYLGKYGWSKSVTISSTQTQNTPDNTEHFGESGDYGSATATKITGKQQFKFTLEHQPAYLVFQPYTGNTVLQNCYLTKIEVTSDNDIAESYTINASTDNLDASAGSKQIVLTTGGAWGSTYNNGFPLSNSSASRITNGAYMVIKPGAHTLKVRYWIKDLVTQVEGAITKSLPSTVYASNTYYDVTGNLNVHDYDGDHYYMWDAKDQYWKGHEWNKGGSQPPFTGSNISNDYPKSSADSRWFSEAFAYHTNNPATHTSFDKVPNINEIVWYAKEGDPRWDADILWTAMGHLYKGGMWFKKKAYISGYNKNTAPIGGDWRILPNADKSWSVSYTLPSAADTNKYFFLPALGHYYINGGQWDIGYRGHYWSSNAHPWSSGAAYCLSFQSSGVTVTSSHSRRFGFRTEPLFE